MYLSPNTEGLIGEYLRLVTTTSTCDLVEVKNTPTYQVWIR